MIPYECQWERGGDAVDCVSARQRATGGFEPWLGLGTEAGKYFYGSERRALRYTLLGSSAEDTGVHRDFAALETDDEMRDFARRYGFLELPRLAMTESGVSCEGEPIAKWRRQIRSMRAAVDLLRALQLPGEEGKIALGKLLDVEHTGLPMTTSWEGEEFVYSDGSKRYVATVAGLERLESPAVQIEEQRPRDFLRRAGWSLLWQMISPRVASTKPSFVLPEGEAVPEFRLRASSLLSAMWLQLLDSATGRSAIRQCEFCGEWFNAKAGREDKRYCGDRCRQGAKRERDRSIGPAKTRSK